jgi:hypothetical protein
MATDGLIFNLDAGNPNCFTEGNTSATNSITGGAVTGASGQPNAGPHTPNTANFPAYSSLNGGIFDFTGGRGMNCDEDLGTHTAATRSLWFYKVGGSNHYFMDGRNDGGQWFISNYTPTFGNYEFTDLLTYNYGSPFNASAPEYLNNWIYLVTTSDATTGRFYLNGVEVSNYDNQASIDEDFGINYRIGTRFTTSGQWTGYMNQINFYNRVLSPDEIKKNFWATRGRYGI